MKPTFTHWRKSRHSEPGASCVEVGRSMEDLIGVRDTKQHGNGPTLIFTRAEWAAFLRSIRID